MSGKGEHLMVRAARRKFGAYNILPLGWRLLAGAAVTCVSESAVVQGAGTRKHPLLPPGARRRRQKKKQYGIRRSIDQEEFDFDIADKDFFTLSSNHTVNANPIMIRLFPAFSFTT